VTSKKTPIATATPGGVAAELFVWHCRLSGIKGADEFTTWLNEFAAPDARVEMTQMRAAVVDALKKGEHQRANELAQHTLSRWRVHVLRPLALKGKKAAENPRKAAKKKGRRPRSEFRLTPRVAELMLEQAPADESTEAFLRRWQRCGDDGLGGLRLLETAAARMRVEVVDDEHAAQEWTRESLRKLRPKR
jgi:hypothetical protein